MNTAEPAEGRDLAGPVDWLQKESFTWYPAPRRGGGPEEQFFVETEPGDLGHEARDPASWDHVPFDWSFFR